MIASELRPFGFVIESMINNKLPIMTEEPLPAMVGGRFNHVPFIIGFTSTEGMEICKNLKIENIQILENFVPWSFDYDLNKTEKAEMSKKFQEFYFGEEDPYKQPNKIYDVGYFYLFF